MGRYHITSHKSHKRYDNGHVTMKSLVTVTWRLWEIKKHSYIVIVYIV